MVLSSTCRHTHTHSYRYSFVLYSLVSADADKNALFCTCAIHTSADQAACDSLGVLQCVCVSLSGTGRVAQPSSHELYLH